MADEVIVISRNPIAREGLCRIMADSQFAVVGSASDANEIIWDDCPEDVLAIVDGGSSDEQVSAVEHVMFNRAGTRCVVLAEKLDVEAMIACFQRQAQGYLVKDMTCPPLLMSLRLVALGERVFPSSLVNFLAYQTSYREEVSEEALDVHEANLSRREMDVLCCLMAGYSNKLIARQLDLSEATIKVHVKAILRKLKVGNRTQAAMWGTARRMNVPANMPMTG